VRLGLSLYNTRDEVQRALDAVRELAEETAKKRKK
jgi:selenocysteine lyase/cysteine desulfurase